MQTRDLPFDTHTHPVGAPTPIPDLTGRIIDGIESLQQRIRNRLHLRRGDWFLDPNAGIPYGTLLQHSGNLRLLEQAIVAALRELPEVTGVINITIEHLPATRTAEFSATVQSIYGDMNVTEVIG